MVFQFHVRAFNVMVVDNDILHLRALVNFLTSFGSRYQVSNYVSPVEALVVLSDQRVKFDILFCGAPLSDLQVFKLVRVAEHNFNIVVIAMIPNLTDEDVVRAISIGASKCVAKPITDPQMLKDVWQHVVHKRRDEFAMNLASSLVESSSGVQRESIGAAAGGGAGRPRSSYNPIGVNIVEGGGVICDQNVHKKRRFVWSKENKDIFLEALASIGSQNVIPTKILDYMKSKGIHNITREIIASHLQKHRILVEKRGDKNVIIPQSSTSHDDQNIKDQPSSSYVDHQTLAQPVQQIVTVQEPQQQQQQQQQTQPNENVAIIPTSNEIDQNNDGDTDWAAYLTDSIALDQPEDHNFENSYDFESFLNSGEFHSAASEIQEVGPHQLMAQSVLSDLATCGYQSIPK